MNDQADNTSLPEDGASPQGVVASCDDQAMRDKAIELAFDYRGDVTLETHDGENLTGYVYDRHTESDPKTLRIMLTKGGEKKTLEYAQVKSITFSGRDCAAGKSWETWVRRYAEKKVKGEKAEITPEKL